MKDRKPNPMVERIFAEGICIAEIMLTNARMIIDHVGAHERGECTKSMGAKGHFHPMSTPEDAEHARRLMIEAPEFCICGGH